MAPLVLRDRVIFSIFGAVFVFIGGMFIDHLLRVRIYGYWRTRDKVIAKAHLKSVELKGSRRPSTRAVYDYEFGGRVYTGDRVALFERTRKFYESLSEAHAAGTPISVFVDSKAPEFAVINRDFSWDPIALAVPFSLGFVGGGILALRTALRRSPV